MMYGKDGRRTDVFGSSEVAWCGLVQSAIENFSHLIGPVN